MRQTFNNNLFAHRSVKQYQPKKLQNYIWRKIMCNFTYKNYCQNDTTKREINLESDNSLQMTKRSCQNLSFSFFLNCRHKKVTLSLVDELYSAIFFFTWVVWFSKYSNGVTGWQKVFFSIWVTNWKAFYLCCTELLHNSHSFVFSIILCFTVSPSFCLLRLIRCDQEWLSLLVTMKFGKFEIY
jgi:hypothetical protein